MSRLHHRQRATCEAGLGTIEMLVAAGVFVALLAALFDAVRSSTTADSVLGESADVRQRLRTTTTTLWRDLERAGAGLSFGEAAGPLSTVQPSVMPFRVGRRGADGPGTVRSDVITVLYAQPASPQAVLATALTARSGAAAINAQPGCQQADASCGFRAGALVLVFDEDHHDLFTVAAVAGATLSLQHNGFDSPYVYLPTRSHIVEVVSRTYSRKVDPASGIGQLTVYESGGGGDLPVVDHITDFAVRYLAAAEPPRLIKPLSDPEGPWTNYGGAPPHIGTHRTDYGPGESCLFAVTAEGLHASRLESLGVGVVPLDPQRLRDGPWCPNSSDPNRWDADLLRIRAVEIALRLEVRATSLRGQGPAFSRPGSAAPDRSVPDVEIRFTVTPPNVVSR